MTVSFIAHIYGPLSTEKTPFSHLLYQIRQKKNTLLHYSGLLLGVPGLRGYFFGVFFVL